MPSWQKSSKRENGIWNLMASTIVTSDPNVLKSLKCSKNPLIMVQNEASGGLRLIHLDTCKKHVWIMTFHHKYLMKGVYCNITTVLCSKTLGYHQHCSTVCATRRSVPGCMWSPTDSGWENMRLNIHSQGKFLMGKDPLVGKPWYWKHGGSNPVDSGCAYSSVTCKIIYPCADIAWKQG